MFRSITISAVKNSEICFSLGLIEGQITLGRLKKDLNDKSHLNRNLEDKDTTFFMWSPATKKVIAYDMKMWYLLKITIESKISMFLFKRRSYNSVHYTLD